MAKKKAKRPTQKRIPGTFDKVTEAIEAKAAAYAETLYERMQLQEAEKTQRAELVELMTEHDVETFTVDGYQLTLTTSPETKKLKIKKLEEPEE
jgi:hypothetical protein